MVGRRAVWGDGGFTFYNFLVNTKDVAEGIRVEAAKVVDCIKAGLLFSYPTPNGHFHLVVKGMRLDALTHMRALAAKVPMKRTIKGRNLFRLVSALSEECQGFPADGFGVFDVRSALEREVDWKEGREYAKGGIDRVLLLLEKMGKVFRVVDSPLDIEARRWRFAVGRGRPVGRPSKPEVVDGVSAPEVSAEVSLEPDTVLTKKNRMVEGLAVELMEQAKQRARELMGL
jgi:hypothetical protein